MRKILGFTLMAAVVAPVLAKDIEVRGTCTGPACQAAFQSVAEDLIGIVDYRAAGPAEATGLTGFGVGVITTYQDVDSEAHWNAVTGDNFERLAVWRVQAAKGLPLGIDVGAFFGGIAGTDVDLYGAELRYAILDGSAATPALTLRAAYSAASGIDTFDLDSRSVDLQLSKGFAFVTPYVGVGYVEGSADPDPARTTGLVEAEVEDVKSYLGARLGLGLVELTPELAQVGDVVNYSLRFGISFGL